MFDTVGSEPFSVVRLRDGRSLAYLEVGSPGGPAIFHFHGHGSSRLEALFLAAPAAAVGVRVIAVDRPGIGRSDAKAQDGLMDWPDDVAEAADHLGIERFAVQGMSAGGPYALACAYKIPHRLTGCGLVSSVAPPALVRRAGPLWMRAVWRLGVDFPNAFQSFLRRAIPDSAPSSDAADQRLRRLSSVVAGEDRRLLRTPELRARYARALSESRRQGGRANRDEAIRQIRPWGFEIERIAFQRMFLWHGEQDRLMPAATARLLAQALPHCRATFYPTEGHFSVLINRAVDILTALRDP